MPITQPESGLSVDDYNLLKTLNTGSVYSIIAHRYNLAFLRTYSSSSVLTEATPDFDAIICNGYLYRAVSNTLIERYDINANTWSTVSAYVAPSSPISFESISLVTDGLILYAFAATTTGISLSSSDDNGATWSSWTQIITVANIWRISAASPTHVHYVVKDTTNLIYNLRIAINSSGWSVTASDTWLQYAPSNIAAVTYGTKDVIAIATEVPGTITVTTVNGAAVKYMKASGGILVFNFEYGSWGDHREVDVVDELTAYRYRDRVKISVINNRLFLTAYTADGTQQFPFTMYRMYTSEDGIWWSKGEAIPLNPGEGASSGIKLLYSGDYVYAVERKQFHRSSSTLATGYSPTAVQVDITASGALQEYSVTHDGMFQAVLLLSNANGWLDDHEIINKDNSILLVHSFGYRHPTTHVPIMVQVAITEVDTLDTNRELPRSMIRITCRDFLAWMSGRTGAERPYIWDSQLLGADDFTDYTSTGYDGLRHLAQQTGSWTADENTLLLQSSNVEGIGFSTYASDLWNGVTQCSFALATVGNSEYAGVVFRAADKDNFLTAYYNQVLDQIVLADRNAGIGSLFATSSTLSWAATPTTVRYIRVEFRYARIFVHTSTDGVTWTQQISHLQASVVPSGGAADKRKFKGFVGFIGRGYAPPDTSNWTPDPGPDFPPYTYPDEPYYTDPYTENPYSPGTIYTPTAPGAPPVTSITLPSDGNTELFWDDTHLKMVTTGIAIASPPERDITPTLGVGETIMDVKVDRYSPGVYCLVSDGDNSRVLFASNMSVYPTLDWVVNGTMTGICTHIELAAIRGGIHVVRLTTGDETSVSALSGDGTNGWAESLFDPLGGGCLPSTIGTYNAIDDRFEGAYCGYAIGKIQRVDLSFGGFVVISSVEVDVAYDASIAGAFTFYDSAIYFDDVFIAGHQTNAPVIGTHTFVYDTPTSGILKLGVTSSAYTNPGDGYTYITAIRLVYADMIAETIYSDDYGKTFGTPKASDSILGDFDVQKAGSNVLLNSNDGTLIADIEDPYSLYGTPKALGSIYIPRLLFGSTETLNDSANPQYLLSALEVDEDDHSLWRVSSSGSAFTNITPMYGGYPGLATGEGCIIGHWMTSSHILGLLSFNGTVKLARSLDKGVHWTFSVALDSGVKGIITRRGDFDAKQVWWINGSKIAYCANYTLPTLTFVERTYSLSPIKGLDIFG